jgi:hypothetical protein
MNRLYYSQSILLRFIILLGLGILQVAAQDSIMYPKDPASGFPSGYQDTPNCVTMQDVASFDKAFIRADMAPAIKANLTKALNDYGVVKIVTDSEEADFLIDISEASGSASLKLWALAVRPRPAFYGERCNIMPNSKPTSKILINELIDYFKGTRIAAKVERDAEEAKYNDGFPDGREKPKPQRAKGDPRITAKDPNTGFPIDSYGGEYNLNFNCTGVLTYSELRALSKVFIAKDIPPDVRAKMEKALNDSGKVTIVDDSLKADFLIQLSRGNATEKEVTRSPTVITSDGVITGGNRSETVTKFETANLSVTVIKHPTIRGYKGTMCLMYGNGASRPSGILAQALAKDPADRMIKDLMKFFKKYVGEK